MKTSFVSFLALASAFVGVFSAPTSDVGLVERELLERELVERAADPTALMHSLYSTVQGYTAQISMHSTLVSSSILTDHHLDSTAAGINAQSSPLDKAKASFVIQQHINSIAIAVEQSTTQVKTISHAKRQAPDPAAIAALVETILLDISGALNKVIAALGLCKYLRIALLADSTNQDSAAVLGLVAPLTAALSALLLALEVVVNDLLALVQGLLDGLLVGLSLALAGLGL